MEDHSTEPHQSGSTKVQEMHHVISPGKIDVNIGVDRIMSPVQILNYYELHDSIIEKIDPFAELPPGAIQEKNNLIDMITVELPPEATYLKSLYEDLIQFYNIIFQIREATKTTERKTRIISSIALERRQERRRKRRGQQPSSSTIPPQSRIESFMYNTYKFKRIEPNNLYKLYPPRIEYFREWNEEENLQKEIEAKIFFEALKSLNCWESLDKPPPYSSSMKINKTNILTCMQNQETRTLQQTAAISLFKNGDINDKVPELYKAMENEFYRERLHVWNTYTHPFLEKLSEKMIKTEGTESPKYFLLNGQLNDDIDVSIKHNLPFVHSFNYYFPNKLCEIFRRWKIAN